MRHLVLALLGMLWLLAIAASARYRDITWLQYLFVDIKWIQTVILVTGGYGAFLSSSARSPGRGRTRRHRRGD